MFLCVLLPWDSASDFLTMFLSCLSLPCCRFFMYLVSFPSRAGWYQDEEKMSKSLYIQQLKGLKSMHLPGDDHH